MRFQAGSTVPEVAKGFRDSIALFVGLQSLICSINHHVRPRFVQTIVTWQSVLSESYELVNACLHQTLHLQDASAAVPESLGSPPNLFG